MNTRKILTVAGSALIISISSVAYGAEGFYVSGNLGVAYPNDIDATDPAVPGITISFESDAGAAFSGAVGYAFGNNVRLEGEISYQQNDLSSFEALGVELDLEGETSALAFGVNGYYDFVNESAFTPFISAGLGIANVEIADLEIPGVAYWSGSEDDTVFAYQFGAGVGYAVNDRVTIDVKYRYCGVDDPEFDTTTAEYSSHNFYAGVRVLF